MADPDFTIADVLAWARTKPADEEYNFFRAGVCALGQFAQEMRGVSAEDAACELYRPAPGLLAAANGTCADGGCTFGGLVLRLEKLCPDTVIPPSEWTRLDSYMTDIETVSA